MRREIELPDELAARVDAYLQVRRHQTFSSFVQQVLEREMEQDERPSIREILNLSDEPGRRLFSQITPAPNPDALLNLIGLVSEDTPREVIPMEERQPEDRVTDRDL